MNQAEIAAQQQAQFDEAMAASAQYQASHMKNSFNFVAEEQENEDMGSDGRENTDKRASGTEPTPASLMDLSNNG